MLPRTTPCQPENFSEHQNNWILSSGSTTFSLSTQSCSFPAYKHTFQSITSFLIHFLFHKLFLNKGISLIYLMSKMYSYILTYHRGPCSGVYPSEILTHTGPTPSWCFWFPGNGWSIESPNPVLIVPVQFHPRIPARIREEHDGSSHLGVAEAEAVAQFVGRGLQELLPTVSLKVP